MPTFAAVQAWAPEDHRARVIAAVNVVGAGFMTVGGGLVAAIQAAGVSIAAVLLGLALLNAAAAWLMLKYLPTNAFRDFLSILFRAFHRLEVEGLENLKAAGPAPILALNHVSFLDGPLALTLTDQEPVFAIDYTIAQAWWVKPFLKLTRALPLNPAKPMSTRTLIKIVQGGDPLVIFPEGRITVTGGLMKVYDGAAMVADKTGSMVVPVRIDGLEKSYFSRLTSLHVRRQLFPKVKVTILPPVRLAVDPGLKGRKRRAAAGAALYQVMSDLVFRTQNIDSTVLEKIIQTARERGMNRLAVQDPIAGSLSYGKLLTGAAVLGEKFRTLYADQQTLGIMLPNANGSCATLLGVMSAGKVPAMINFTAGAANIVSACKAAEVRTILTSRAFVEQAKLGATVEELSRSVNIVWLDDLRAGIGLKDKLLGLLRKSRPRVARRADDAAVILFTSGSEGTPKGVVLTHRNILANAAQAASRIDFHAGDKVFNVLPIFHSFGLTAGTVLPLISGVPVYFYPSPLHYRIVPELIYGSNATIIFGTDTFLGGYARTAHPYDFRSVRYCFAGAEPVKASTRETYMEKFGLRILEGYGVTETSPVISINTPMYNRSGTVGKIMPGHGIPARSGARHRRRRAAACARSQRHGRLPQGRKTGCARSAAGRLARHRRHRGDRRWRFRHHPRPRQALRQDRRRDDLACRRRGACRRAVEGLAYRRRHRAGRPQGREAGAGHRRRQRHPCRIPRLRQGTWRHGPDGAGRSSRRRQDAGARLRQDRLRRRRQAGAWRGLDRFGHRSRLIRPEKPRASAPLPPQSRRV